MTTNVNKYCSVVRGFIDEATIKTLSLYMENKLKRQQWDIRKDDDDRRGHPSQYMSYADPMAEVVLNGVIEQVEQEVNLKLHPTYSYSRIYMKGDDLTPHVDRSSCEVSVTINIATVGNPWPIWMKAPGQEPIKVELMPGDAVIYKGCEVVHWRDKMVDSEVNVQFMLHYVDQNGPHVDFKWDKRPGLGYSQNARSN